MRCSSSYFRIVTSHKGQSSPSKSPKSLPRNILGDVHDHHPRRRPSHRCQNRQIRKGDRPQDGAPDDLQLQHHLHPPFGEQQPHTFRGAGPRRFRVSHAVQRQFGLDLKDLERQFPDREVSLGGEPEGGLRQGARRQG